MPTPKDDESEDDFVDRCIPMVIDEGTAKDGKQAAAICHSMYKQHHKKEGKRHRRILLVAKEVQNHK